MEKFGLPEQPKNKEKEEELLAELRKIRIEQIKGKDWTDEKAEKLKELEKKFVTSSGRREELTKEERKELTSLQIRQIKGENWTEKDMERIKELQERE